MSTLFKLWCGLVPLAGAQDDVDIEAVEQAANIILEHWVEEVDPDELTRAALEGMLQYLDNQQGHGGNLLIPSEDSPATKAMSPNEEGIRFGIGVEYLASPGHGMLVTEVFDGSPAAEAGIEIEETIVSMGEGRFAGRTRAEIHRLAQSASDPVIRLEIMGMDNQTRVVQLERGPFQVNPVRLIRVGDQMAIRLQTFSRGTARGLVRSLQQVGDRPLILDLRDNSGGLLEEAIAAAEAFLEPGSVLGEMHRRGEASERLYTQQPALHSAPVVILVNQGTAEVAELFAIALQEQGRASIIGVQTAGIACHTGQHTLATGEILRLTDTEFRSPHGHSWEGEGLVPDLTVDGTTTYMVSPHNPPPDLQFEAALRLVGNSED